MTATGPGSVRLMSADRFVTPSGSVTLQRPGQNERSPLQAWDAADGFALEHLADVVASADGAALHVLVVNDAFGALALGLASADAPCGVWSWSDSAVAHDARRNNAVVNDIAPDAVVGLTSADQLTRELGQASLQSVTPDVVIIKIPKALALLEYQLVALSAIVGPDTAVVGAGMTRHIHTSTIELFERIIGPTRTTKAQRKARLILSDVDPERELMSVPDPVHFSVDASTVADGTDQPLTVWNQPGVFSQKRLDIGTRFLLQSLPSLDAARLGAPIRVVDLGCGNGVVGTVIARRNPDVELTFVDESALAVDSARRTWQSAGFDLVSSDIADPGNTTGGHRGVFGNAAGDTTTGDDLVRDETTAATFVHGDATASNVPGLSAACADVVVLNPPFHDHHAVAVEAGRALIGAARELLVPGGRLFVVANRHVAHHVTMRRIFGRCDIVASDPKFVVMESRTRAAG